MFRSRIFQEFLLTILHENLPRIPSGNSPEDSFGKFAGVPSTNRPEILEEIQDEIQMELLRKFSDRAELEIPEAIPGMSFWRHSQTEFFEQSSTGLSV